MQQTETRKNKHLSSSRTVSYLKGKSFLLNEKLHTTAKMYFSVK